MDIDSILADGLEPTPRDTNAEARAAASRVFASIDGKLAQFAHILGERPVTVYAWRRRGLIPAHAALKIEALAHPRLPFTAPEIRPDVIDWDYVRSKTTRSRV